MNRRIYLTSVFRKNRWNVFVDMVVHLSIEKCCIQPKATLIRDRSKKSDSEKTECLILAVFLKLTLYGRYIDDCISATSALPQRYLIYQRGAHSLYNRRQFLSPGSEIYPGNFRNFFAFLDVKISNKISSITFKLSWLLWTTPRWKRSRMKKKNLIYIWYQILLI